VIRTVGEDHEPRQFSVWSPVALAAIRRLAGAVEGRSILIRLRRRRADEPIQPFRLDRTPRLAVPARVAARWAEDNLGALTAADPIMPDGIHNCSPTICVLCLQSRIAR
jgi:putative DNA primase/helicase